MESIIIQPQNELLKTYVDYFLFFKKTDHKLISYATFPNNNLCLAIYKNSHIQYLNQSGSNQCIISPGNGQFRSRLFGFHKMPFNVEVNGALDQICILFKPAAMGVFTSHSYADLMNIDHAFDLFSNQSDFVLEQIFEEEQYSSRAQQLEKLLLTNLKDQMPAKLKEAFHFLSKANQNESIEALSKQLGVSTPTLFRLFKNNVGMSPKSYLKTLRFRTVLHQILTQQHALTRLAHVHNYFDQAHFINDFKSLSGYSPNQLIAKVSVEQQNLAWIYNNK